MLVLDGQSKRMIYSQIPGKVGAHRLCIGGVHVANDRRRAVMMTMKIKIMIEMTKAVM
jgi:hypothetical protein